MLGGPPDTPHNLPLVLALTTKKIFGFFTPFLANFGLFLAKISLPLVLALTIRNFPLVLALTSVNLVTCMDLADLASPKP